jgi:hypothetical protein
MVTNPRWIGKLPCLNQCGPPRYASFEETIHVQTGCEKSQYPVAGIGGPDSSDEGKYRLRKCAVTSDIVQILWGARRRLMAPSALFNTTKRSASPR